MRLTESSNSLFTAKALFLKKKNDAHPLVRITLLLCAICLRL